MSVIDFNQSGELDAYFTQESGFNGTLPEYFQSTTGGITGGSVTSYPGTDYSATAVYDPAIAFATGSTVTLSMDFQFDGNVTPLAPGANGVRSFRLGLLNSLSSFEAPVVTPSAYIEGVYSLTQDQMFIAIFSTTTSVSTNIAGPLFNVSSGDWYQVRASFTNVGNTMVSVASTVADLGPQGTSSPVTINTFSQSFTNTPLVTSENVFSGFSALGMGGVERIDNFSAPAEPPPLCFCAGTRIVTPKGEIPIEYLLVGDLVLTHLG